MVVGRGSREGFVDPWKGKKMSDERKCQHVTKTPIYIKSIGGMAIDRSEWEDERGAFFRYDEKPCLYIADPGEQFCPRHRLERETAPVSNGPKCNMSRPWEEPT